VPSGFQVINTSAAENQSMGENPVRKERTNFKGRGISLTGGMIFGPFLARPSVTIFEESPFVKLPDKQRKVHGKIRREWRIKYLPGLEEVNYRFNGGGMVVGKLDGELDSVGSAYDAATRLRQI
jgi:hypothetical protein